jgi:hypothetical protein
MDGAGRKGFEVGSVGRLPGRSYGVKPDGSEGLARIVPFMLRRLASTRARSGAFVAGLSEGKTPQSLAPCGLDPMERRNRCWHYRKPWPWDCIVNLSIDDGFVVHRISRRPFNTL